MRPSLLFAAAFAVLGAAALDARPGLFEAKLAPTGSFEYHGVLAERQVAAPTCRLSVWPADGATCQEFITKHNITMAQMAYLNPFVGSDCAGFRWEERYCVRGISMLPPTLDGTCSRKANMTCIGSGFGDCCGYNGRCGTGYASCAIGNCQAGDCPGVGYSIDGVCGTDNDYLLCGGGWGKCCSNAGRCGSTSAECAVENCAYGDCDSAGPTSTTTAGHPTGTPSLDGSCGGANRYSCLGGEFFFGFCCGADGKCGRSADACNPAGGCQAAFGMCDVIATETVTVWPPVSSTTSSTVTSSTPPSPTPTFLQTHRNFEVAGCFREPPKAVAFLGMGYESRDNMTAERCLGAVSNWDIYPWAGLQQNGHECWYGEILHGEATRVDMSNCQTPCPGNPSQFCGGAAAPNGTRYILAYSRPGAPEQPTTPYRPQLINASNRYLGCITEATGVRTLSGSLFAHDNMTLETCSWYCINTAAPLNNGRRFWHFGVEYGRECWCGNEFNGNWAKAPDSDCSFTCPGNKYQYCGAGNRLSVYSIYPDLPDPNQ